MRERKGKMSLLKSDFKGQIGYGEYCRLYRKAMGCIESCDIASAKNYMRHMKWSWCGKCLEHRLLKAMLLFAQATKNDYQKILSIFQKMRRELRAFLLRVLRFRLPFFYAEDTRTRVPSPKRQNRWRGPVL